MKTLATYHVCNHSEIGEKTFENILIGPGKLPGLSRNGPQLTQQILRNFKIGYNFVDFFAGAIGALDEYLI